jgi:uncharacterized glyoxalase superfamily protein PhnB
MDAPNLAVVELKAFIPAKDFALSMEFYEALGFTRASVFEDVAHFHCGDSSFLLQDFFIQEHAENYQMHLLVENVDAWHEKAKAVGARFNVKVGEPETLPWAMRDFTLFDSSGVLWRIAQNLPK